MSLNSSASRKSVCVQHPAVERLEALELRHVRCREVTGGDNHVVELLGVLVVLDEIMRRHRELAAAFIVADVTHRGAEADPVTHAGLLHPAFDIIEQHRARRIGRDRLAEVLFERIVGELQPFLGPVRPKIAVHRAVYRLAIFIRTGAPGVVPQAAPVVLLFKTHDLRDVRTLFLGRLKGPQLCRTRRASPDNRNAFGHWKFLLCLEPDPSLVPE